MTTKVIEYKSSPTKVSGNKTTVLETGANDGIIHTWCGYVDDNRQAALTWNFDWEDLKIQGFDRLVGHLIVNSANGYWHPSRVDIDWTEADQSLSISKKFSSYVWRDCVSFEYFFTAYCPELPSSEEISYEKRFAVSDKTDAVLIVEKKKLNVNKTFLSFHSDYFSTLFSSNLKEGQMEEIEIKEVSYKYFGLLLSSFYPNPQFPNDNTVEKLLEMARRFQVSSVTGIVEYHLLHVSKIRYEKMLWLADEYVMPKLLEKCINQMNSLEKAQKLKKSPEFEKLSDRTSTLILRRLLEAI